MFSQSKSAFCLKSIMQMMGRPSSFLSAHYYARIPTWKGIILVSWLLLSAVMSSHSLSLSSTGNKDVLKGMTITSSPITRIKMNSNGRTNSRFLRTYPRLEFLHFARRDGHLPVEPEPPSQDLLSSGNSPVFYIRLPPSPYVLVPGLGYVSPHPYNSPMLGMGIPPAPVMMNPFGMLAGASDLSSSEQSQKNVISLPLKFLSNGRPSQIDNPKKKPPSKVNSLAPEPSKTTTLISGGKYSFNGRPNGVFVVRSPVGSTNHQSS